MPAGTPESAAQSGRTTCPECGQRVYISDYAAAVQDRVASAGKARRVVPGGESSGNAQAGWGGAKLQ